MNLQSTYNKIAKNWSNEHNSDTWWIEGTDRFISFLNPKSVVLDVGCGSGVKSKFLVDEGLKVVGIDFSQKMIEIAQKRVPNATFLVMDLQNVQKLENNFDGIFMQAVLLHIPKSKIEKVLRGLVKKLKRGGYVYIAVKEINQGQAEEEIKVKNDYGYKYERFFSYFTLEEVKKHLNGLKMNICYEKVVPSNNTRWIQIIARKA